MKKSELVANTVAFTVTILLASISTTKYDCDASEPSYMESMYVSQENSCLPSMQAFSSAFSNKCYAESITEGITEDSDELTDTSNDSENLDSEDSKLLDLMNTKSESVTVSFGSEASLDLLGISDSSDRFILDYDIDELDSITKTLGVSDFVVTIQDVATSTSSDVIFKVNVIDTTRPVLKGLKKNITIIKGKNLTSQIKKGVTATDNVDGKIPKSKIKVSKYNPKKLNKLQKVTLSVKDNAGNIVKKNTKIKIVTKVKKMNKVMYTKSSVGVYSLSSGKKLKDSLAFNTKVKVIAQDRITGWYKIKYSRGTGWVSNSYLKTTKSKKPTKTRENNSGLKPDASNCACSTPTDCLDRENLDCMPAWDCLGSVDASNKGW